jgi:hypothetical protein
MQMVRHLKRGGRRIAVAAQPHLDRHFSRQRERGTAISFVQQTGALQRRAVRESVAVLRAAQQDAAAVRCSERRAFAAGSAAAAAARCAAAREGAAAAAEEQRARLAGAAGAARGVGELEGAARSAATQSLRLARAEALRRVGPAGGLWGSKSPAAELRPPLPVTLVGAVTPAAAGCGAR